LDFFDKAELDIKAGLPVVARGRLIYMSDLYMYLLLGNERVGE
jgi:hypothetical protein